mgnify:CR=1 FL=1
MFEYEEDPQVALPQDWTPEVKLLWPTATDELLLRAATANKAADRPWPMEFGREFAAAL